MFSVSAQPNPMATAPSIWPLHCIGLISRPMSAACTLCRIRIFEAMAGFGSGGMELDERNAVVAADDAVVLQAPRGGIRGGLARRIAEDVVTQRSRGQVHGLAGHDRSGAGEGASVVRSEGRHEKYPPAQHLDV